MTPSSTTPRRPGSWPFLFVTISLFGAFALLSLQAVGMWELGPLDWPFRWMYRLSEVALVPFTLIARVIFPPRGHHHVLGFFVSRAALAAPVYALGALWLWRFLRRCFVGAGPRPRDEQAAATSRDGRERQDRGGQDGSGSGDVSAPSDPPRGGGADRGVDEGRRRVLAGGLAITAGAATLGLCGWMTGVVPARLRLRSYRVVVDDLPEALEGLKIAHLTDTHLGPFISADHILEAVALANRTEPDLTVLTGDYVHRTPDSIEPGIGLFSHVRARLGVVAVLGNHDHWEGADACRRQFATLAIPLIDNDRLFVTPDGLSQREVAGQSLAVGGVGDLWEDVVDLDAALSGVSATCPRILLSHNPDFAEQAGDYPPEVRVDLQISGHTHGGQVLLPALGAPMVPSRYGDKYAGGWVDGPRWPVIVSRGVGMAVLPIRLGVEPEVGLIELVRA